MDTFAVIGLGRFGSRLAIDIYNYGAEVIAVDSDQDIVDKIGDSVSVAICADARNKAVLEKIGVQNCDTVIVAIGSDLGVSALVTMNLKELGIKRIICKASDETNRTILSKLGADKVVIPEHELAHKLSVKLTSHGVMDFIEISDKYGIDEIAVPKEWVGKTIGQIDVRAKYSTNIIAIKNGDTVNVQLTPDTVLEEGFVLLMIGTYDALKRIGNL